MRILGLIVMLLLMPPSRQAEAATADVTGAKLDAITARGVLRVGMTGDYAPFAFLDLESGDWAGLDVDMSRAMAQALGVKLEIVKTSWPTLMPDLMADKFDMAAGGVTISLDRQKAAFFSTPIIEDGKIPITRCENMSRLSTLAQIDQPGVRVMTPPGGTNETFDRTHLSKATIILMSDNQRMFEDLVAGHGDVVITDASETMLQHKIHPELCPVHPDHPFNFTEKAYMLPRDVALQQWVDAFLHLQSKSGTLQTTIQHWLN